MCQIPMDLLTNAIESIQVGVDDYESGSRPRLLSAVRNIHAGILLLYKEALRRDSPKDSKDVLVMAKISPLRDGAGNVTFVGEGKKTVDTQQIRERFAALGFATDWKRFDRVNDARNDVEHLVPRLDKKALQGLISDSFLIIRDFIAEELGDDPRKLLGEQVWQTMLAVSEVHEKERQECEQLIAAAKWVSETLGNGVVDLTCETCGSDLLKVRENSHKELLLECSSCGQSERPESYVPRAIASELSSARWVMYQDGGETPYVNCPECNEDTYVIEERQCALCGHQAEHECQRCGNEIPPEELDSSPYCGWCEHMMNKDD